MVTRWDVLIVIATSLTTSLIDTEIPRILHDLKINIPFSIPAITMELCMIIS